MSASGINHDALANLVREAMASGVVCFADKVKAGEVEPAAPLTDAFGDFPGEFLRLRPALVAALHEDIGGNS